MGTPEHYENGRRTQDETTEGQSPLAMIEEIDRLLVEARLLAAREVVKAFRSPTEQSDAEGRIGLLERLCGIQSPRI